MHLTRTIYARRSVFTSGDETGGHPKLGDTDHVFKNVPQREQLALVPSSYLRISLIRGASGGDENALDVLGFPVL